MLGAICAWRKKYLYLILTMAKKPRLKHDVCKPCWELKYCPYSPLVEFFPLVDSDLGISTIRSSYDSWMDAVMEGDLQSEEEVFEAIEKILCLEPKRWEWASQYEGKDLRCSIFGHICPVFLSADVNSDRKFLICADRKFLTLSVRSFPQARCGGVGLGGAVGNWLGDATAHESGGDKPVIHSGRAARLLFRPAATTRPSCGGGPSRTAAGSGDPASCSCSLGC